MHSRPHIAADRPAEPLASYESFHLELSDGAGTTMHVGRFDRDRVRLRVVALDPPTALSEWCCTHDCPDAMIGGFFLDGGGSASLVLGGRLRNRPREEHGIDLAGGRPISTALVFTPR